MDAVCEECGDAGFRKLLLRCSKCKRAARHRYCLDVIIFDSVVDWSCSGCIPKHNQAIKSLEDASNQMQLSNTQSGCSMINEQNVDNEKVTKTQRPRTNRPRRRRKYHVDESTKHFLSGDTSNLGQCRNKSHKERKDCIGTITPQFCSGDAIGSCEVFLRDIPNRNDCEKEREDRNGHLTCAVESSDGSSGLPLDHASECEPKNLQKEMDGSKLASNSVECTDLTNVRSGCFASSKHVEGLVPQGRKGDVFSLTNKSHPTSASVKQAAGLSVSREKPVPLKAVKGFETSIASKFAPNRSNLIQGSELKTESADVLSPKQHLDSWSMVPMQSSPSNVLEDVAVQENSAERTSCLVDEQLKGFKKSVVASKFAPNCSKLIQGSELKTESADVLSPKQHLDSSSMVPMQSSPPNVLEDVAVQENSAERTSCLVDEQLKGFEKSVVASKFAPNYSKLIQGSELKTESADVSSPKQHLDSWSMVTMQSSPSNVLENVAVQENSAERTSCLVDEQTNTRTMENLEVSKPSMENECLVSNEGNLDKTNRRSDEVSLITKAKKMPRRMCGDREKMNCYKKNGISNPETAKGDRDPRSLQLNAGKPSYLGVKKMILKRVLQEEGIDNELLPSKFVGPCESTKINPRKRKQSESYNPDGTNYQKVARSKGGRPALAASSRDSQNMPGEDKKGKYKKMDKLWLSNKASRDRRKRGMVRSVLQPSFLHRNSVDKSRACSENIDLALQKSIRPLNNPRSSCKRKKRRLVPEFIDAQPLDKPYWTGIMKIDKNYVPLAAHLSVKAGKKVQEHSRSLPKILEVTKLLTSKTCPMHLEPPIPSADSIGLYFFSGDMRPNKELDQLVKHVADSGIILEAIVGLAKLFLFPSSVLPEEYQTFQGKPYLWGVFKPKKDKIKRSAPVEQDCTAHITKEDVQKQHVLDQQDKVQGDTLDQVTPPENQPLLDANEVGIGTLSGNGLPLVDMRAIVSGNISQADHGQPCSNPEAPPLKLCGIVMSGTPRSAELIQELQKEGAFLFAVQQVMAEPGLVV